MPGTRRRFRVAPCRDLDEFGLAVLGVGQYFGMELDAEADERFSRILPLERMHAAWEGESIVGGAGAFPFAMSVPGGADVPTAGVTVVGTYPTHRRRGVLRSLMRAQLDDVHERGEPVAALWASAETIYGRFGYGIGSFCGSIELPTEHTAFAASNPAEGRVSFVETDEALRLFPRVWDAVRRRTPGMMRRSREWWELRTLRSRGEAGAGPKRLVAYERAGRVEGYAIFRHKQELRDDGVSTGEIAVAEAIALDGVPTQEVWRFLLSIDWTARFTARLLPPDHPLFFLLATPRRMRYRMSDGLWVRLVDVGAALSARQYAADGVLVLDVVDDFCPWNAGRWRLADGVARRSTAAPHVRCDVSALGAAYLGGVGFSQLLRGGRLEELRRGACTRADAMFAANRSPWCPEIF